MDPSLTLLTKINSKWSKDINIIPDIIKLLEENIGKKLLNIGLGSDLLGFDKKKAWVTKTKATSRTTSKQKVGAQQKIQSKSEKADYRIGENICKSYMP